MSAKGQEETSDNAWFARVWKSQQDFEAIWKDAPLYRDLKG